MAVAQQRAVLSTIADMIVAVARNKSLRVAIRFDHWDGDAFADRLTQALLARGRDCRCPPATRGFEPMTGHPGVHGRVGARRIAIIISGSADPADPDVCRINVQVNSVDRPPVQSGADGRPDLNDDDRHGHNRGSDVIVDYLATTGPVIRHLASWLAPFAPR